MTPTETPVYAVYREVVYGTGATPAEAIAESGFDPEEIVRYDGYGRSTDQAVLARMTPALAARIDDDPESFVVLSDPGTGELPLIGTPAEESEARP